MIIVRTPGAAPVHLLCLCAVEVNAPTVTAPPSSQPSTNSSGVAGRALLVNTPEGGPDEGCAPGPERLAPGGIVGLCLVAMLVASSVGFVYARQRGWEDDASELAEARNKDLDDLAPSAAAGEGGSGRKRGLAFLGDAARGGDGCSDSAVCAGDPDGARDDRRITFAAATKTGDGQRSTTFYDAASGRSQYYDAESGRSVYHNAEDGGSGASPTPPTRRRRRRRGGRRSAGARAGPSSRRPATPSARGDWTGWSRGRTGRGW
jgi:hypothetical protein